MAEFRADGIADVIAGLDKFGVRVYRRAAADALTETAFEIRKLELNEIASFPEGGATAFTKRKGAVQVNKASFKKDPVESQVFVAEQQARYLSFQVFGGTRIEGDIGSTGGGILTPIVRGLLDGGGSPRLTKQGNLPNRGPRSYLRASDKRKDQSASRKGKGRSSGRTLKKHGNTVFVGRPEGRRFASAPFGVWRRLGVNSRKGKLRLEAAFSPKASYKPGNFDFFGIAEQEFDDSFLNQFQGLLDKEIGKLKGWQS